MTRKRKQALIRLLICLAALAVSIVIAVFLVTSAGGSEGADTGEVTSTAQDGTAESTEGAEGAEGAESQDAAPESQAEPESEPEPEPTPEPEPEPTPVPQYDGLEQQPTVFYGEGEQPGYTVSAGTSLRLRGGPGTDFSQVGQVPDGTAVTALGANDDGSWVVVQYNGTYGWLATQYLAQ